MSEPKPEAKPKPMEAIMSRFGGRLGFILLAFFLLVFALAGLGVPLGQIAAIQYWLALAAAVCLLFGI